MCARVLSFFFGGGGETELREFFYPEREGKQTRAATFFCFFGGEFNRFFAWFLWGGG